MQKKTQMRFILSWLTFGA